jgi:hypothetical protein
MFEFREHVRPSLKAGIRMYLVVFLGTTYCMYRMHNFWTESVSADNTGTGLGTYLRKIEVSLHILLDNVLNCHFHFN